MTNNKKLLIIFGVIFAVIAGFFVFWLLADPFAQKNDEAVKAQPTKVIKKLEMSEDDYPIISMALKNNDHYVDLIIDKIPEFINDIEFEFLYNSIDENGQEFQKGQFDNFEVEEDKVEKEILLGTSSCTTGTCKYKYDENISSGKLILKLKDAEGKIASFDIPFLVVKEDGDVNLSELEGSSSSLTLTNPNSPNLILHKTLGYYTRPSQDSFSGPYQISSSSILLPLTYSDQENLFIFKDNEWVSSSDIPLNAPFIIVSE